MKIFLLFLITYFICFSFFLFGNFIIKRNNYHNTLSFFSSCCIFGAISISLLALLINFFYPLNYNTANCIVFLTILIFFYFIFKKKIELNIFVYTFLLTVLCCILLLYSNIFRPDAGLYHLPYIKLIQESKILVGISNIHFRFGHISIIQYLSAIYSSNYFLIETVTIPPAVIVSSFFLFFLSFIDKNYSFKELKILVLLLSIYSYYSFNRYSNFGNDASAHLFLFLFLITIFQTDFSKFKIDDLGILSIIAAFAFMQKVFLIFLLLVCFILYLKFFIKNFDVYKNKKIIFSLILVISWLIKNTLTTGCVIFPVSSLCFEKLTFTDMEMIKQVSIASESWAKAWPNRNDNLISMTDFNKNFSWFSAWFDSHFKIIHEKFFMFIYFLLIILFYSLVFNKKKNYHIKNIKVLYYCIFLSLILSLTWFFKFPLYRYGQSSIASLVILIFLLIFLKFIDLDKIKKILVFFSITVFVAVLFKNFLRIVKSYNTKNPLPNIYTLSENINENIERKLNPIIKKNKIIYYHSSSECMYNMAPCSNFHIKDIQRKKFFNYYIYFKSKN